jgi:hypothetical protein
LSKIRRCGATAAIAAALFGGFAGVASAEGSSVSEAAPRTATVKCAHPKPCEPAKPECDKPDHGGGHSPRPPYYHYPSIGFGLGVGLGVGPGAYGHGEGTGSGG